MLTLLNTSILTDFGSYNYEPLSLKEAKNIIKNAYSWKSAIGHESTAKIISTLLDIDCPVNRINYKQEVGDAALIFKLKSRAPEGKILSVEEIENIGYEWGLLVKFR